MFRKKKFSRSEILYGLILKRFGSWLLGERFTKYLWNWGEVFRLLLSDVAIFRYCCKDSWHIVLKKDLNYLLGWCWWLFGWFEVWSGCDLSCGLCDLLNMIEVVWGKRLFGEVFIFIFCVCVCVWWRFISQICFRFRMKLFEGKDCLVRCFYFCVFVFVFDGDLYCRFVLDLEWICLRERIVWWGVYLFVFVFVFVFVFDVYVISIWNLYIDVYVISISNYEVFTCLCLCLFLMEIYLADLF